MNTCLLEITYSVAVSHTQTWRDVVTSLPVTGKNVSIIPQRWENGHFWPFLDENEEPYTVTIENGVLFSNSIESRLGDNSCIDAEQELPQETVRLVVRVNNGEDCGG